MMLANSTLSLRIQQFAPRSLLLAPMCSLRLARQKEQRSFSRSIRTCQLSTFQRDSPVA